MPRILIVDDDVELCELLQRQLERDGFGVVCGNDVDSGEELALGGDFDLIVLDIMLPGGSGLDLLRTIRTHSDVPVVMLTARGEEIDRIVGLELGADDYLPKPFNPRELVARLRAVLRRSERTSGAASGVLMVGDLEVDPGTRTVSRGGGQVRLTGLEFSLLERLVRSAGGVVDRRTLFAEVLGRRASSADRSLDVHIASLRRKLGPGPDGDDRIKTVRGVGYLYVRPATRGKAR